MKKRLLIGAVLIPAVFLVSVANPSWAWYRGARFGVYIGPGAWGGYPPYDPYYYNAYYGYPGYPAYPYYPYSAPYYMDVPVNTYEPQNPPAQTRTEPDNSRQDLTRIERTIKHERDELEYNYEDGDISREDYKAGLHRLAQIRSDARAEAKANDGTISGEQEREFLNEIRGGPRATRSIHAAPAANDNLKAVSDRVARLRSELDKKLKDGKITKEQHNGMADYLDRTEKQAKSQAAANDGSLSSEQEDAVMQQLSRAENAISENFVVQ